MNCPTELSLAMYSDGELARPDTADMEQHLLGCDRCRARVTAFRQEVRVLAAALVHDATAVSVKAFERPVTIRMMWVGALLVAAALSVVRGVFGAALPAPLAWFNPFDVAGIVKLVLRVGIFVADQGGALVNSLAEFAGGAALVAAVVGVAMVLGKRIRGPFAMASIACAVMLQAAPSHAMEIRSGGDRAVFIAADETIDDTLIAVGDTVEVNGNVNGDLVAFGRDVVIRGKVAGVVIAGGQNVRLDGDVDGSVFAGGEKLDVVGRVGRNLFAGGENVGVGEAARVEQNALVGGEQVSLAGHIGRDVVAAGESLEVASTIGGSLTTLDERMTLLAPAHVHGDVNAHGLDKKDHVVVSPGAVIEGKLVTTLAVEHRRENRFLTLRYYGWQLLWLVAALLSGVVLFSAWPDLRDISIDEPRDALRASAIGVVGLVATPIIAVLACVTLIGLPLGLIALMLWAAAIYVAKLVVAFIVGERVVGALAQGRQHFAVPLAAGLLVVTVAESLPFVGGLVSFGVTVIGLGLLVSFVRDELAEFDDESPA